MRKVLLVAIVLALAIAAAKHQSGTSGAGSGAGSGSTGYSTAHQKFLTAQHKYDTMWGDRATDAELMTVGNTICTLHRKGMSDLQVLVATAGYRPPAGSRARSLGMQRISDAKKYICP